ncbi:hypothetical protein EJP02_335 [Escherichia phage EJP2]|nr:hypothetical protein EJP02_335 [Escherichia phage EJP2]
MTRRSALDIETLSTPEHSGYSIVVPNFAFVTIPEGDEELEWMYVKCPIQDQLDAGLKLSTHGMDFWYNLCAKEYQHAHKEVLDCNSLSTVQIYTNAKYANTNTQNLPLSIRQFVYGNSTGEQLEFDNAPEVFGNGCNFDCSILQQNILTMYGTGELWHYSSPQNARTLKNRINPDERDRMDKYVSTKLEEFCASLPPEVGTMQLHHPLYDAAREALQMKCCLDILTF